MTDTELSDQELERLFTRIAQEANVVIDKLVVQRDASVNGNKQKLRYLIKKLEIIVGSSNLALDRLENV